MIDELFYKSWNFKCSTNTFRLPIAKSTSFLSLETFQVANGEIVCKKEENQIPMSTNVINDKSQDRFFHVF